MGNPLEFTPKQLDEIAVLGELVIYRSMNRHLREYEVGMITAYIPERGMASIFLIGGYHFQDVPYDKDLSTKGTWCYKSDITPNIQAPRATPVHHLVGSEPTEVEPAKGT